jgi:hypothetical protein
MAEQHYYYDRVGSTYARPLTVRLQATFASGVATVDTVASDPGLTLAKDSTGDYDLTFPPGRRVHCDALKLDLASDTPATTTVKEAQPRALNATAGTGKVLFFRGDTAALADPPDGARLYATLTVESGVAR